MPCRRVDGGLVTAAFFVCFYREDLTMAFIVEYLALSLLLLHITVTSSFSLSELVGKTLLAPSTESTHHLKNSALLVIDIISPPSENPYILAVNLNNPTAFTVGEMTGKFLGTILASSTLYRGGGSSPDQSVTTVHAFPKVPGSRRITPSSSPSPSPSPHDESLYVGGDLAALEREAVEGKAAKVKFFFGHVELGEEEVENYDVAVNLPSELVLSDDPNIYSKSRRYISAK